ncbi:LPS-assembly protein LptD [Bythopirellula polymerisocia]|uniref:LPS-assembly protein LptD n=1 Tax=Bythopirellula polymerisocia TaxID=2528003 RepID=UPI0018D2D7E0|nr:LPS-assembly protein LptD [Bythopirellula polymerisocia]
MRFVFLFTCILASLSPTILAVSSAAEHAVSVSTEPVTIAADWCCHWQQGNYEVWHLRGNCYINQGLTYARAPEAVLWIDSSQAQLGATKVVAYFESGADGNVVVDDPTENISSRNASTRQNLPTWFKRLETTASLKMKLPQAVPYTNAPPQIYQRGLVQFDPARQEQLLMAQYTEFVPPAVLVPPSASGMRRVEIFGRSDVLPDIESRKLSNGESAIVASGGIRVLVEGLSSSSVPAAFGPVGTIDLTTDRAVIWTAGGDLRYGGQSTQDQDTPLEIYMEGNIEFRQGDRVVYADRMFYDVRRQVGVILNAELLTPLPQTEGFEYQGLVRLRAAAIRQLDEARFTATDALVTTSRLEEPSYAFGAEEITFQDLQTQSFDPRTGSVTTEHRQLAESNGNFVYVSGIPVFYWPTIATDLSKPSFFIDNISFGNDRVFGFQTMVDFNAYQLFGIRNAPAGTDWGLSLDYLSKRGIGYGTDFSYERNELFGFEGPAEGAYDFWGISDNGSDNLGFGRRDIVPEEDYRFRLFGQHRQRLNSGWDITGGTGWLSDRTFLEEYYEQEWDENPIPTSGLRAKRLVDNRTFSIEGNVQVNDFFTETEWLPRADHYWLGESLLGDHLTWFEHSQAAYAKLNYYDPPTNPTLASQVIPGLPWEATGTLEGERLVTRQELDLPFSVGGVKVVPYALGELAQWGEDFTGDRLQRAYFQTGVRASVPFWAVYPNVRDTLFNLNGLSHKVVFDVEASYADANRDFTELPLYDPLDDISIIEMDRRLYGTALTPTISGNKTDARFWAFRSGIQGWVTSPTTEIADDLMAVRTGMRHRWQTKRGGPGRQHIIDWLTIDSNITYFPDANRDNFGQDFGLFDYYLRWHLGDRFTVVSDGAADFFGQGLRTIAGGVIINRPTRGNTYLGVRSITGPIESNALLASFNYRLSPKWITSAGVSMDFSDTGNIGQSLSTTRIGESLLVTAGVNSNTGQDNFGFQFMVEPRFLPKLSLTSRTGIEVPPAGAFGLE